MEDVYLYVTFSYLFMWSYLVCCDDPLFVKVLLFLMAPLTLPIAVGALCGFRSRK